MTFISRTLSTQHPDNVRPPFFADRTVLGGEDEIKEAFYAFSHLNSKEQLWDYEGKEVDNFVIKKLLTKYEPFFSRYKLGKDRFLTLRVPNPDVEKNEAKILLETLESIPRSFDIAKIFYKQDIAPIFEIAVPMVTSYKVLVRITQYYKRFVIGKQHKSLFKDDITISKWIGNFNPKEIRIIPLIEDMQSMLNAHQIVKDYLLKTKIKELQRVWLARSDPALNYGSATAVLIEKIALQRLHNLQQELSTSISPIMGCGSAPFRGNFKPTNVENCLKGYPSVQTFTIQSAFKYDYDENIVRAAVDRLNSTKPGKPIPVDENKTMEIIKKLSKEYQSQIKLLAPIINKIAKYIPARRKRKLHIGLFGYSRAVEGIKLPRAIKFCASLYSLGFTPELLGLNVLTQSEIDYIKDIYPSFTNDIKDALQFLNKDNLHFFPKEIVKKLKLDIVDYSTDRKHKKITSIILNDFKNKREESLEENISRAASIRGFLG